jgi:hypothetical protein
MCKSTGYIVSTGARILLILRTKNWRNRELEEKWKNGRMSTKIDEVKGTRSNYGKVFIRWASEFKRVFF